MPYAVVRGSSAEPSGSSHAWYDPRTIFENAVGDIKDLQGVPAGIAMLGSSLYHDARKPFGLSSGPYQADDLFAEQVKAMWGMHGDVAYGTRSLLSGDVGGARDHYTQWLKNMAEDPVYAALDAATFATAGGALAGRAALTAARLGRGRALGRAGARVAGLDPKSFMPATRPIRGKDGVKYGEYEVARNPVTRGRQRLREGVYRQIPETTPLIGGFSPQVRGTKKSDKLETDMREREVSNVRHGFHRGMRSLKLSRGQEDAAWYRYQGFDTAARLAQLLDYRRRTLEEVTADQSKRATKRNLIAQEIGEDLKAIERASKHLDDKEVVSAVRGMHSVGDPTNAAVIRSYIRKGDSLADAKLKTDMAKAVPLALVHGVDISDADKLRAFTLSLDPDYLASIGHVTHYRRPIGRGAGTSSSARSRGIDEYNPKELRHRTGEAFRNASYDRDIYRILDSFEQMALFESRIQRLEAAISVARPWRSEDQALIAEGKLEHLKRDDPTIIDIERTNEFIRRNKSEADGLFTEEELLAVTEASEAIAKAAAESSKGLVMSKGAYRVLAAEYNSTSNLVTRLADTAGRLTKQWRHLVLSLKGSFYVNNFLGNLLLGFIAYGPRFVVDTLQESLPGALRGKRSKLIDEGVSDIKRTAAGRNVAQSSGRARFDIISLLGNAALKQGVKITEDNFRRAGVKAELRRMTKDLKRAHKATTGKKLTTQEAIDTIFNDRKLVETMSRRMYDNLLDYSKLTDFEREILLVVMPFWNFTRSIAGRTVRLYMDEPWKALVLQHLGHEGIEAVEAELGFEPPDYLKGVILGGRKGDEIRATSTYGANPFAAGVDLFEQVASFGGDPTKIGSLNPIVSFNPFIKVPLEAATGKDFFYNSDLDPRMSFGERLYSQGRKNIPVLAYYDKYTLPSKRPNIRRDAADTIRAYLGYPTGYLNPENVQENQEIARYYAERDAAGFDRRAEEAELRRRQINVPVPGF